MLGLETLTTIIEQRGSSLYLINIQEDEEKIPEVQKYNYEVKSVSLLNANSIVALEKDSNNLRLLTLEYKGNQFFEE